MSSARQIRRAFLDYFVANGHAEVDSSPLVPRNDPSLMFTNSGMVQFKNIFTGRETPSAQRAVTAQKCVRAGGKHNDLENVGYTARHHTFFEMLGNFSFGDYFKDQAITFAWDFITKELGLPQDKLLVTIHSSDEEAGALWRKIAGLSDGQIIRIPTSDNFWSMGAVGPCGPCTEIFYDHGAAISGGPPGSPEEDGDRFIEIWNLVFMQFDQLTETERVPLPKPCVDTGMGLERMAAVLQGKHDNYDVDHIRALLVAAADGAGVDPDGPHNTSLRVIADHLRCAGFLISDGVTPSNEGRGYVLRRIMRRAMRHVHLTECGEPLMAKLVPELISQMGGHYQELQRAEALISDTLHSEETRFRATLERGLRLLAEETARLADGGTLPGNIAFKLYDTYGFPLDLTCDALRAEGKQVDLEGFHTAMAAQKSAARQHWAGSGEDATSSVLYDLAEQHGPTEFLGYKTARNDGEIVAILVDGKEVQTLSCDGTNGRAESEAVTGLVVVNQTPFYAESGGQLADTGVMYVSETETEFEPTSGPDLQPVSSERISSGQLEVKSVQKQLGLWLHEVTVSSPDETLSVGDKVTLAVDDHHRSALRRHHSATHLLHAALRETLGPHVTQKGALVAPDRLRFDFSHPKLVGRDELDQIETVVAHHIYANSTVETRIMAPEEAIEAGAMALFGEKYGDEVRVVTMGHTAQNNTRKTDHSPASWSMELCGGLHVAETGEIGAFVITSEQAVASGVRRIEALTGAMALAHVRGQRDILYAAALALKVPIAEMLERLQSLISEQRSLQNELTNLRNQLALSGEQGQAGRQEIDGRIFASRVLADVPARDLKSLAERMLSELDAQIVSLCSVTDGKISLVVAVDQANTEACNAVELVRIGAAALGGKGGGGRPDMAQAGGHGDAAACTHAISAISEALARRDSP